MFIGELIIRRSNIRKKIDELKIYLSSLPEDSTDNKGSIYKECLDRIFILLEEQQQNTLLLNSLNNSNSIKIGSSDKVSVSSALILITTTIKKIKAIDDVIGNNDPSIDIFKLIEQRDSLMEEYILLKSAVSANDWGISLE